MNGKMSIETFLKKTYTVAYRLTGDENTACNLAEFAIANMFQNKNNQENVYENMFKLTAAEICITFLNNKKSFSKDSIEISTDIHQSKVQGWNLLQEAILNLEPLSRVTIIWRDVLGYKLTEILPKLNHSEKDLHRELSNARRQLKKQINKIEYIQQ